MVWRIDERGKYFDPGSPNGILIDYPRLADAMKKMSMEQRDLLERIYNQEHPWGLRPGNNPAPGMGRLGYGLGLDWVTPVTANFIDLGRNWFQGDRIPGRGTNRELLDKIPKYQAGRSELKLRPEASAQRLAIQGGQEYAVYPKYLPNPNTSQSPLSDEDFARVLWVMGFFWQTPGYNDTYEVRYSEPLIKRFLTDRDEKFIVL